MGQACSRRAHAAAQARAEAPEPGALPAALQWARLVQRILGGLDQVARWRRLLRKTLRTRRLQRIFAYCGHHLKLAAAGGYLRARIRVVWHSGKKSALTAARRDLARARPLFAY